jgi:hypothetical protein
MRFDLILLAVLAGCYREPRPVPIGGIPDYGALPRDQVAFDCDAASGFRSEVRFPVSSTGTARGAVYFVSVREDDRSHASANVVLRGPQDGIGTSVSFGVDPQQRQIQPEVRNRADPSNPSAPIATLRPRPTRGAFFELQWKPSLVRVRLEPSGPWLDIPTAFAPDQFILGCSTGNAVFHSVKVESAGAAPTESQSHEGS